jgi:transposase
MADWLEHCGIETIAMEATGVYWIPVFQILETRGFEVKLVNSRHVKMVPGRKSDIQDCQWLQQLHTCGLLAGSFRPDDEICVLRSYWRHRDNLVGMASAHVQHMQKAMIEMGLHLHKVISDITGVTGMRIIHAILEGEHDPVKLAKMKDRRVSKRVDQIAKALHGDYRQEHLFALKQAVELYETYVAKIEACDREIETYLEKFEDSSEADSKQAPRPKTRKKKVGTNEPTFDLRSHLYRISGVDFTAIPGLGASHVMTIVSEVGLDPSAFPATGNFCSWLGLCPNHKITGGRVKSAKTRRNSNRAATAFRLAAESVARSQSALGAFYRRKRSQLGAPKAITATAHKIARIFYRMWTTGESYQDAGADYYEQKYHERILSNLKKRAAEFGFELVQQVAGESEVTPVAA